jgi:hypothetical protein
MAAPTPSFARFIAIDWSGARARAAQRRAIVRCVATRRHGRPHILALASGWDRRETVEWLAECARDGAPTLVGLDFPFGYATPFLDRVGAPDFFTLLSRMMPLDGAPAAPRGLAAFVARCGRWWARWGASRGRRAHRRVECRPETRGAESPLRALPHRRGYRFVGPRHVGKAAITGLAAIGELKARVPGIRVWPFERFEGASLVLAEIWPRLALGRVTKSDRAARERWVRELVRRGVVLQPAHARGAAASDHATDALGAAVAMASGRWVPCRPDALPAESRREGWILGVDPGERTEPHEARRRKERS